MSDDDLRELIRDTEVEIAKAYEHRRIHGFSFGDNLSLRSLEKRLTTLRERLAMEEIA